MKARGSSLTKLARHKARMAKWTSAIPNREHSLKVALNSFRRVEAFSNRIQLTTALLTNPETSLLFRHFFCCVKILLS